MQSTHISFVSASVSDPMHAALSSLASYAAGGNDYTKDCSFTLHQLSTRQQKPDPFPGTRSSAELAKPAFHEVIENTLGKRTNLVPQLPTSNEFEGQCYRAGRFWFPKGNSFTGCKNRCPGIF